MEPTKNQLVKRIQELFFKPKQIVRVYCKPSIQVVYPVRGYYYDYDDVYYTWVSYGY